jgi:hypothetical protein
MASINNVPTNGFGRMIHVLFASIDYLKGKKRAHLHFFDSVQMESIMKFSEGKL